MLLPQTSAWGDAFEHWVILEIYKNASYLRNDWKFYYFRTKDDLEIDLIIDRPGKSSVLIEIKSKQKVSEADVKTLESLGKDIDPKSERYLFSMDPLESKWGETRALHWQKGMQVLFLF